MADGVEARQALREVLPRGFPVARGLGALGQREESPGDALLVAQLALDRQALLVIAASGGVVPLLRRDHAQVVERTGHARQIVQLTAKGEAAFVERACLG